MKRARVSLASVRVVACGDGDDPLDSALRGIYAIDTWTENTMGCGAEGPSTLAAETDRLFDVEGVALFGQQFINANRCVDLATCQAEVADDTITSAAAGRSRRAATAPAGPAPRWSPVRAARTPRARAPSPTP